MKIKMESGERISVEIPTGRGSGAVAIYDNEHRVIASLVFEDGRICDVVVHGDEVKLPSREAK